MKAQFLFYVIGNLVISYHIKLKKWFGRNTENGMGISYREGTFARKTMPDGCYEVPCGEGSLCCMGNRVTAVTMPEI